MTSIHPDACRQSVFALLISIFRPAAGGPAGTPCTPCTLPSTHPHPLPHPTTPAAHANARTPRTPCRRCCRTCKRRTHPLPHPPPLPQVLRPFMLRRLKEAVASELPGKREVVLRCGLSPYQRHLLGMVRSGFEGSAGAAAAAAAAGGGGAGAGGGGEGAEQQQRQQRRGGGGGGGAPSAAAAMGTSINNTVMELRNICNHPFIRWVGVVGVVGQDAAGGGSATCMHGPSATCERVCVHVHVHARGARPTRPSRPEGVGQGGAVQLIYGGVIGRQQLHQALMIRDAQAA